jgi:hypothetical protein
MHRTGLGQYFLSTTSNSYEDGFFELRRKFAVRFTDADTTISENRDEVMAWADSRSLRVIDMTQPIRRLLCSCCGASTCGRQWFNMDTGYGICPPCWKSVAKRRPFGEEPMTHEEMVRTWGHPGVHHSLSVGMP